MPGPGAQAEADPDPHGPDPVTRQAPARDGEPPPRADCQHGDNDRGRGAGQLAARPECEHIVEREGGRDERDGNGDQDASPSWCPRAAPREAPASYISRVIPAPVS